ncbi:MAG: CvpA family protein [Bacteroidetes bacterium]|nr:CvpA family protein [Bacteroidota bacterium]
MEPIDIVILLLLGLGAYEGYKKGLLMTIIGLLGFVLAIVLGVYFMGGVSKWLATETDEAAFALPIIAFLLIFFSTLFLANLAGRALKKMMTLVFLGGLDSLGGAVLGIVRAGFFISLLVLIFDKLEVETSQKWKSKSEFLSYIEPLTPEVIDLLAPILPTVKEASQTLIQEIDGGNN